MQRRTRSRDDDSIFGSAYTLWQRSRWFNAIDVRGLEVHAAMKFRSLSTSEKFLIIGDSGEAVLLAAICHATEVSSADNEHDNGSLGTAFWVRSIPTAVRVARDFRISMVLIDEALLDDAPCIVDCRSNVVTLRSIRSELETRLGRIYPAFNETPEQFIQAIPPQSRTLALLRRGLEVFLAAILFAVTAPLLLGIGALYRLVFGPSQFVQVHERVGEHAAPLLVAEFSPWPLKVDANSRVERVASSIDRNLRRMHLNGVPAFAQVLTGQLSLVGPVPVTSEVFQRTLAENPLFGVRTFVRPGLISLARVRLRNVETDYDLMRALEYDLYYIKHRSLRLDARILIRAGLILTTDILATTLRIARTAVRLTFKTMQRQLNGNRPRGSAFSSPPMPKTTEQGAAALTPTLLIGAGAGATLLVRELQLNHNVGLWPVALVDDNVELVGTKIHGVPVLGTIDAASAIVDRERIEAVVMAIPSANPEQQQRLVQIARSTKTTVFSMPSIGQILTGATPTALVPVPVNDLLGRPLVEVSPMRAQRFLGGKRVLITGAAGSIGREVVNQSLRGEPAVIYGLDINESDLYDLQQELLRRRLSTTFVPVVGSVCDVEWVERLMQRVRPHVVFHAAAYKHVPLMEDYPQQAVRTNIGGTWIMATVSARAGVERFVLVSTDKAVHPTSVMGASKRIAELLVQELASTSALSTCSVRFGNVLGSRGSVVPLFERQIEAGGPVTITDAEMRRYFMTIPEAAGLIIEAGAFGDRGVVYMLDMGDPVRIEHLAKRLIQLKGLRPGIDIEITYTGLRPGEKLFEELALDFERARPTPHEKIRILDEGTSLRTKSAESMMARLFEIADEGDPDQIRQALLRKVREADRFEFAEAAPVPSEHAIVSAK